MINIKRLSFIILVVLIAYAAFLFSCRIKEPTFQERSRQGHTMSQWLKILRANTNSIDDPLKIVRITRNSKSRYVEIEVPISYDLLIAHDFLDKSGTEKNGKFDLVVNSRVLSTGCERSTNGNCILGCDIRDFANGTNQVQVEFFVFNLVGAASAISSTGPITQFVTTNN
jgi:hypothetical protein